MADKVSEASWKAFLKKQKLDVDLDDKDLLKALSRFDKSDPDKPGAWLQAADELIKEIPRQLMALGKLKAKLGDKPFGLVKDELNALLDEAEKQCRQVRAALDAAENEEEVDDDDSAAGALVDPKQLFKQLSLCRKVPMRPMKFAFVDGKSKEPGLLALHPRVSGRALFAKLQAAAGVKTGAFGSTWVDEDTLILQLDKPVPGLVKKVRPILKACGFRIGKVVLWAADGAVFEQDLESGEGALAEEAEQTETEQEEQDPAPDASLAFKARLAALLPAIKAARTEARPGGQAAALKASEAGVLAGKGDFAAAHARLDEAEALLAGKAAPPPVASPPAVTPEPGTPPKGVVALQRSRLMWIDVRKRMLAETRRLTDTIVQKAAGEPDAEAIREASEQILQDVLRVDERLQDLLEQLTEAPEGRERELLKREAGAVLSEYQAQLSQGIFLTIDANPVLPVAVAAPARTALAVIAQALA